MKTEDLETPALVVDWDVVERNLETMSGYCQSRGIKLRPHVKTHKSPFLASRQIQSGACGISVAKPGEAEVMVESGLTDILLAYPVIGKAKAGRVAALAERASLSTSLDSREAAEGLSLAARERGSMIGILVEVDVGFHRCGVQTPSEAFELARRVSDLTGLEFRGLMFYPGSYVNREDQEDRIAEVNRLIAEARDRLQSAGLPVPVVSGGSTPTARFSHRFPDVTEIRPGTYIFNDRNTVAQGAVSWTDCAAAVLVTVVSTAVPGRAIIDGGSKTFSTDPAVSGNGLGVIREDPDAVFEKVNEEHGYLNVERSSRRYRVGEKLTVIPNHICPTVNLHEEMFLTRAGVVDRVCPVSARGKIR